MAAGDETVKVQREELVRPGLGMVAAVINAAAQTSGAYISLATQNSVVLHRTGSRPEGDLRSTKLVAPDGNELRLESGQKLSEKQLEALACLVQQALATHFKLAEAQEELRQSRQELSLLFEFSQTACRVTSVEDLVDRFLFDVVEVLDAEEGTLLGLDKESNELKILCYHGSTTETIREFRLPVGIGIAGKVCEDGIPRLVNDTDADPDYVEGVNPVRNVICAPIRVNGEIVGVISVNDRNNGESFELRHLELLTGLIQLGEIGLENARLYGQVRGLLFEVVDGLVKMMEANAPHTAGHSRRVARLSYSLGRQIGLDTTELERLYLTALAHELGAPPTSSDTPRTPWTEQYTGQVESDDTNFMSAGILTTADKLTEALPGLGEHLERYDGFGHPKGLKGDEIALQGRIIAVAHAFDTAIHSPSIQSRRTPERALEELISGAGTLYDPQVVEDFKKIFERFRLHGSVPPADDDMPWKSTSSIPNLTEDEK